MEKKNLGAWILNSPNLFCIDISQTFFISIDNYREWLREVFLSVLRLQLASSLGRRYTEGKKFTIFGLFTSSSLWLIENIWRKNFHLFHWLKCCLAKWGWFADDLFHEPKNNFSRSSILKKEIKRWNLYNSYQ